MNSNTARINRHVFTTGDRVQCTLIRGSHDCLGEECYIDDAKIYIDIDQAFICQNVVRGIRSPDNMGYKYGWLFGLRENGSSGAFVKHLVPLIVCNKPRDP